MALSDIYHDSSIQLLEDLNHYLNDPIWKSSESDKKRAEILCKLLMEECSMLDRMGDGLYGDPESVNKHIVSNIEKEKKSNYAEYYNQLLDSLKIKVQ